MALQMTMTTARLSLAVCLSTILASCASGPSPSAVATGPSALASPRFQGDIDQQGSDTQAPPRVYIDSEQLETDAPDIYKVVRGDTLWDISDRFLKEPWRWTEIWGYNPQVSNPHLIYPGDELALDFVDGRAMLMLSRNGTSLPQGIGEPVLGAANPEGNTGLSAANSENTSVPGAGNPKNTPILGAANPENAGRVKLSPRVRSESLDNAIPTISGDSIAPFLAYPLVVDAATLSNSPYVIANSDNRLISSIGSKIYVRGQMNRDQTSYGVFRKNKPLIDPVNGANLGFEVTHVADAKLLSTGDPSTLGITSSKMETIAGDIVLPLGSEPTTHTYAPRLPELHGEGRIISLVNALALTGRDQVVVLNLGEASDIQKGDVLAVESRGASVVDKSRHGKGEKVTLPNQRTGVLMVFKTFDKVSYALVMESTRPLEVNDIVTGI